MPLSCNRIIRSAILGAILTVGSQEALAVQASVDESGQVLLFPVVAQGLRYDSLLSLTNGDAQRPMVLRVTVRNGADGSAIARLNVFLGAGDTFAAAVDGTNLTPTDATCFDSDPRPAGGAVPLNLEGAAFLEVIEMATVRPGTATATMINDPDGKCAAVRRAVEDRAALNELDAPAGSMTGSLTLIDVPLGLSFSISATALDRFRETPMYEPVGSIHPNLNDAEPPESVLFGEFRPGGEPAATLRSAWEHPVDAVSAVLMANELETDFNVEPGIAAATDLVLTFPTRHHYQSADGGEREPFVTRYVRDAHNTDPIETPGQQFLLVARNREGDTVIDTFGAKCSPVRVNPYPGPLVTGSQINLRVGADPVIAGMPVHEAGQVSTPDICASVNSTPVRELMESGTLDMDFGFFSMMSLEGHVHLGLPLMGVSLTAIANETTTLANYGITNTIRRSLEVAYPVTAAGPDSKLLGSDLERTAPGRMDVSRDGGLVVLETDVQFSPEDPEGGDLEKIGHTDVYLFRNEGTPPELLTPTQSQFPEDVRTFDLSEDGRALAYTLCEWVPDGPDTGHCDPRLRLRDIGTGGISAIGAPAGKIATHQTPVIADGGSRIAYVVDEISPNRLYLFDATGGTSTAHANDVKWLFDMTPDGSLILFSRGPRTFSGDPDRLLLVNTATGEEVSVLPPDLAARLDAPGDHVRIEDAAISSSGRHVAFESTGDIHGVFRYDLETDALERLSAGHHSQRTTRGLDLGDEANAIVFSTEDRLVPGLPPGTRQVYLWRSGGTLEVVSTSPGGMPGNGDSWYAAMSGDANTIAYGTAAGNIVDVPPASPDPFLMRFHFIRADLDGTATSR